MSSKIVYRPKFQMILLLGLTVVAFNAVATASASAACREFIAQIGEIGVSLTQAQCLAVPQVQNTNAGPSEKFWLLVTGTSSAEWLSSGNPVTSELLAITSGELLLEESTVKA